ncbi:hypothetical protein AOLI_G00235970 [Acnodon oligacanthus]
MRPYVVVLTVFYHQSKLVALLEKVGLEEHDDPSPPAAVLPEKTPELTLDLSSESLDTLFSAHHLGNETPEVEFLTTPEHEREESQAGVQEVSSGADCLSSSLTEVEEVPLNRGPKDSKALTVPPAVVKKTAEELVKRLETFKFRVPVTSFCERLVDHLMDELKTMSHIRITHQVLGRRLFFDENGAVSHIVNEAYKSLLKKRQMTGASHFDRRMMKHAVDAVLVAFADYALGCLLMSSSAPDTNTAVKASQGLEFPEVQKQSRTKESKGRSESAASANLSACSCSTVLSEPDLSDFEDLVRECDGSPDLTDLSDLSDDCSAIFEAYQRYGPANRPGTYLVKCAEAPLEDSPDFSHSTPAVQVIEATENLVENEDLETPANTNGTADATTCRKMKKQRLSSRVFNFLKRRSVVLPQTLTLLWWHHSCLKFRRSAASTSLSAWSCSTVLSEPGLSEFEDLIRECRGSLDLSDLSDECSAIFTGYQSYRRYGPAGVDPELYELTQAKMEVSGGGSRVADAFARLMSTVEKTNTSTSGGSSLLNLDFFGPVDESPSSSATSIPGVDPELYELTQAKMEVSGGGSRVADAFARLMSTVEKTNTSTSFSVSGAARPRREGSGSVLVRVLSASPSIGVRSAHRGRNERIDRLDHVIPNSIGLTAAWFGSCGRCRGDRDVRASVTSQRAQPL